NSGHFAYVNTKALEILNLCGVLDTSPEGSCQKTSLTPSQLGNAKKGQLMEEAVIFALLQVIPKDTKEWLDIGFSTALKMSQKGYTTVSDGGVVAPLLKTYNLLTRNKDFPLNVVALPLSEFYLDEGPEGLMATWKKLGELAPTLKIGPVKFFADGSPQGYSAFLLQPYQSRPPWAKPDEVYRGEPNNPELLSKGIEEVHRRGKQVAVHVNGDASTEMVLNTLEQALQKHPRPDTRHQLIHLPYADTNPNLTQLKRIQENGFVATFLSRNIYYWGQVLCQIIIGAQRVSEMYPARKAGELGLKFSLHSDAPVNPPDPLQVIYSAVTRRSQPWDRPPTAVCPEVLGPEQRITRGEGLKAYTINAAHQFFLDKEVGSLEKEKMADFVILSKNPLTLEEAPEELLTIDVLATVHHGRYRGWQGVETRPQ
ncbi:MAG: amidohydrolase family protein, partial [bacterium]|nr:amidohydrolase family protein [bacterium]